MVATTALHVCLCRVCPFAQPRISPELLHPNGVS